MKRIYLILFITVCTVASAAAQTTLEECLALCRRHYPYLREKGLLEQATAYSVENAATGHLPQVTLSGKATWQTDVTKVPIHMAGVSIPEMAKDQYNATVEVNQLLWDGGRIRSVRGQTESAGRVEQAQVDVSLYALRQRVEDVYFGVLLLDEQLRLNGLLRQQLSRDSLRVAGSIRGGVANEADADAIRVEQLTALQTADGLQATRSGYMAMLSALCGVAMPENAVLARPDVPTVGDADDAKRPELTLFDAQRAQREADIQSIRAKNLPSLGAFVQGGYGRPGLNMLSRDMKAYALGGIRLTWQFGNLYTKKNELRQVETAQKMVDAQREAFMTNLKVETAQERAAIQKYRVTLQRDDELIRLRENIRVASASKQSHGTLDVTDYMRDVTKAFEAHQERALHEIQWLKSIYQLKNTLNQ